ncbi:hypothetical protein SAY87_000600 [Trapa incisa]|uniref:Protein kinase domain-containing protein n=1 Tax=Trapa incisa TaxID=236973 RepID=A0AAN7JGB5_9MYRT|nr:hypothetical protein SAY87_000600 [Trapa incisa]
MGAQVARLVRTPATTALASSSFHLLLIIFSCLIVQSIGLTDSEILLKFRDNLANTTSLSSWNTSSKPCSGNQGNWVGVRCSEGTILALKLENLGLMGYIDVETLRLLPRLRSISFMRNAFHGPLPRLQVLGSMKSVFLSNNRFSGDIPNDAFAGMASLKKVHLAHNGFTGSIPSSLTTLPRLLELRIDDNQFQGPIPDFLQRDLKMVNLSNNGLRGSIPPRLSKMDPNLFSGNVGLCGQPLESCESRDRKIYVWKVAVCVFTAGLLLGFIIGALIIYQRRNRSSLGLEDLSVSSFSDDYQQQSKLSSGAATYGSLDQPPPAAAAGFRSTKKADHKFQLTFVSDDSERFNLQDLLRASAEVLGSGNFGSSYKAIIANGQAVVVKRYKQMNGIGRQDFNEHMKRLGSLKHPNILPLVAYYYRKEEKLLVYDFVHNGSLANHLHGNNSRLDWRTRLSIIKGIARGLEHLYTEFSDMIISHGHLKSSNVLLNENFEPLLNDYALSAVTNPELSQQLMVAFRSPECLGGSGGVGGRVGKKSDVWCLGVLILETLTGRYPVSYIAAAAVRADAEVEDANMAAWVAAMIDEESTSEVLDREIVGTKGCKGEMIKLLKIGLSCCERDVDRRPSISEAARKIDELRNSDEAADSGGSSYVGEVYRWRSSTRDDLNC